ncbi:GntR family transcriptional regulator [Phaeobacter sp. HF9A]|uniref:GntR family transcriptional regulator n=1 Tax=Phaeobacter sp. HF9A TaxID=2721561 RepID=UPI001431CEB5|nr:GntR family transcriptional regulator [Phaeobacter sp. HF9A]NIZ13025.1 GntR family transcriptional regulator [Phaeobacter sp. HF9A]
MSVQNHGNLRQTTYEAIKRLIVTGQLPHGSRVAEADLAERLKVSRTPVREALNRLERDGFVLPRPRSGYSVMTIDMETVNEAFDVRDLLESETTRLACRAIDDSGRAALNAIIDECDRLAALPDRSIEDDLREMQIGIDLHRVIADLGGNRLLCDLLDGILDRCQAYIWLDVSHMDTFGDARDEHRVIVEAICRGDEENAIALTRRHVEDSRENILTVLRRRQGIHGMTVRSD